MEILDVKDNIDDLITEEDIITNDDIENTKDNNYLNHSIKINNEDIEIIDDIFDKQEDLIDIDLIDNISDETKDEEIKNDIIDHEITNNDFLVENIDNQEIQDKENLKEDLINQETENEKIVNTPPKEKLDIINEIGENISTKEYITNPAIGRDKEIQELIVTLLTPEKSAILVGKPGIGKTAIVEGLGYRIKNGNVPDNLKGYTVYKLNTASLTGTMPNTNELKIQYVVDKLKELDKIMVFIDEIHTLIGNGENTLDFANIFKPLIDRGTIKLIGATTSDEYDRYILKDKAFVRRFQKIDVSEPTRETAIQIMMGTYPKFEKKMNLKLKYTEFIKENIMAFIVDATTEFNRVYETSVRYPDISLTILQQAFSYAAFDNRKEVNIRDIKKAIQTTKLIYPDVIKKELVRFNTVFKDVYLMETKQILKGEE